MIDCRNEVRQMKQYDLDNNISKQISQAWHNKLQFYLSLMTNQEPLILIVLLVIAVFSLSNLKYETKTEIPQFQHFKLKFTKTYPSSTEEFYRKTIFLSNLIKINQHNDDSTQTYKLGVTPFADLTHEEFAQIYLVTIKSQFETKSLNTDINFKQQKVQQSHNDKNDIDWVSRGNVSPVKSQGVCGSCWAFSAAQALQSTYSIYRNLNVSLSEQQLVDCSSSYGNNGCSGGRIDYAYAYIKDHGLSTQRQYPYAGRQQSCKRDSGDYKISRYASAAECSNLYNALQQRPISVGVDASTWALYRDGILSVCGRNINHGVLLVGVSDGYWRIKNSWGVNWGENGYIRISRGNTCAVCESPFYPVL